VNPAKLELLSKIQVYFKEKHNVDLSEKQLEECYISLRHLGRAIFLYSKENALRSRLRKWIVERRILFFLNVRTPYYS
jgi:hypothetical protein